MKKFLSSILNSGTPKQRKQKTFALMAIAITAALLVIALVTLCALAIADAAKAPAPEEEEGEGAATGVSRDLVTYTMPEGQLYRGNLIVVNDTYLYSAEANADVDMIQIQSFRSTAEGDQLYSSNATMTFVQKEALGAMNEMALAFYTQNNIGSDNYNLYVNLGSAGAATGIYAAGNTFELRYTTGVEGSEKLPISADATYNWIFQNAYKYGFIQLFDDADTPDGGVSQKHIFRYVGVEHATLANDANCTTLDAYLAYLRENTGLNKTKSVTVSVVGADGKTQKVSYKIFYQAQNAEGTYYTADPNKFVSTVSGDNMSGYIVSYCAIK